MTDPDDNTKPFGLEQEPATLSEWAIVLGLLTGVVVAIIFTVRALTS